MALKALIESLADLPEALHSEYIERDIPKLGKRFVLDIEAIDDHPQVVNLKSAHERQKITNRELSEKLRTAEERLDGLPDDFNVDEYERLKTQAEGKEPPKTEEQVARVREQLERKSAAEIGKRDERIKTLEAVIQRKTVDEGLTKALVESGVAKELMPAARALLKEKGAIKLQEDEGQFEAIVETDMGPMPLQKYVAEWATGDEGKVFVSKPTGGDAKGGNGKLLGENPFASVNGAKPNLTKQQELIVSNPERARQLARAAGVQPNW